LTALGFTVAPDGVHPFGTANACVFFSDGSYLEPLAIANRRHASLAAKRGNVFTDRDIRFRGARKREGLSAVVVGTQDAAADHARFVAENVSAGEMLEFSRPMQMADGSASEATFRLAFAAVPDVDDVFLFSCQRIAAFAADRGGLDDHANAVIGLSEIIVSAANPQEFARLFSTVFEAPPETGKDALRIEAVNARIRIHSNETFADEFRASMKPPSASRLAARGIIFKTTDLAVTEITLAANDVAFIRRDGRVIVSAAPGQGLVFGFEE
jgi:hypothetical protein